MRTKFTASFAAGAILFAAAAVLLSPAGPVNAGTGVPTPI